MCGNNYATGKSACATCRPPGWLSILCLPVSTIRYIITSQAVDFPDLWSRSVPMSLRSSASGSSHPKPPSAARLRAQSECPALRINMGGLRAGIAARLSTFRDWPRLREKRRKTAFLKGGPIDRTQLRILLETVDLTRIFPPQALKFPRDEAKSTGYAG